MTSGSIVIDVWKDTYANFPPIVADTITASAKPTLVERDQERRHDADRLDDGGDGGRCVRLHGGQREPVTQVALQLTLVVS